MTPYIDYKWNQKLPDAMIYQPTPLDELITMAIPSRS